MVEKFEYDKSNTIIRKLRQSKKLLRLILLKLENYSWNFSIIMKIQRTLCFELRIFVEIITSTKTLPII